MNNIKEAVKAITIPTDFTNLHDLGELVNNYALMSKLQNALNNYQETYFKSFIKTYDEVLDYIPESETLNYKIRWKNYYFFNYISYWDKEIEDDGKIEQRWGNCDAELNKNYNFWARRDTVYISHFTITDPDFTKINEFKNKKFIVNDKTKEIIILIEKHNDILPYGHDFTFKDNKYTVNVKKQQLTVEIPFEYKTSRAIGGVWINGRKNGYLSGDYTHVPYTRYGYYKYIFDTNTNTFINYEYYIDPEKEWEPIRSRY